MGKKKKEIEWSKLNFEDRKTRLSALWIGGKSDQEIADVLSATKGQIVGFRQRHLPDLTPESRVSETVSGPVQESTSMPTPSRFTATDTTHSEVKPKMAASEKAQCDHNDQGRCGFEWTTRKRSGKYCDRHAPLHE